MKNKPIYLALLIVLCACSINENIEYIEYNDKYENDGVYNYVLLEDNTYGVHSVIDEKVKMSIPDFYNGKMVTSVCENAFYGCKIIEEIEFGNNLKVIGDFSFYDTKLKDINIPNSVTHIGEAAFTLCNSLESISIPELYENYYFDSFIGFSSFEKFTQFIYKGCLYVGNEINPYLYLCQIVSKDMEKVEIHFETKYISSDFLLKNNCKDIIVSNDSKYFKSVDGVLYTKDLNTLVCYPSLKTKDNLELSNINLGNYSLNRSKIKELCLDNVDIIGKEVLKSSEIERIAFSESVDNLGTNMFSNCDNLKEIIVNDENNHFKSVDNILYSKDMNVLYYYPIAKENLSFTIPDNVKKVNDYAFYGNKNLEIIDFNLCEEIGKESFYLSKIRIIKLSNVKKMNYGAFMNCYELEEVSLGNALEIIDDYVFYECYRLKELTLSDKLIKIGNYCFAKANIKNITIPYSLEYLGNSAFFNSGLESIKFEGDVKYFGIACFNLSNLKRIELSDSTIELPLGYLFKAYQIEYYIIPSNIKKISTQAFSHMDKCKYIVVPDSVEMIEEGAFLEVDSKIFFEFKKIPSELEKDLKDVEYYLKGEWEYVDGVPMVK